MLSGPQEVNDETSAAVGNSDRLGESGFAKLLHSLPGGRHGVLAEGDLSSGSGSIPPGGREALLGVNVSEGLSPSGEGSDRRAF